LGEIQIEVDVTLILRHEDVLSAVTMVDAIAAVERGFREEAEGGVLQPPRINIPIEKPAGFLRLGPCVMTRSRWMGFKAMNLAEGTGCRYQVHLFSMDDGVLHAIMDAQFLTTLRTGATSALATRCLVSPGARNVGVIGSGREAFMQLEGLRAAGFVKSAKVFSPSEKNCEAFAAHFRDVVGIEASAVASAEQAVAGAEIVVAAVASKQPALLGKWLQPGMHVNSVGTARPTLREIDEDVFRRSKTIVVDTREGVFNEAGDCIPVKDWLDAGSVTELHELVTGKSTGRESHEEITLFKSVGTAVQDIALAVKIYENATERGLGSRLDGFPAVVDRTPPSMRR
jgi:alanine dehydrogenase